MPYDTEFYKEKFLQFDTSGDGKLTFNEFKQHIEELLRVSVSDLAARNLFDSVNKGSDDYITIDEWLGALDRTSIKDVGEKELREAFSKLDKSGDGKLSKSEMRDVLKELNCSKTDEAIDALFNEADASGDGFISPDEFIKAFFNEIQE